MFLKGPTWVDLAAVRTVHHCSKPRPSRLSPAPVAPSPVSSGQKCLKGQKDALLGTPGGHCLLGGCRLDIHTLGGRVLTAVDIAEKATQAQGGSELWPWALSQEQVF